MKGGIELSLVLSFGMMFLLASISVVSVMVSYNNARFMQEQIVSIIEYYNKYDDEVQDHIQSLHQCYDCQYTIEYHPTNRYHVKISFPIQVLFVEYRALAYVSGFTIPIS